MHKKLLFISAVCLLGLNTPAKSEEVTKGIQDSQTKLTFLIDGLRAFGEGGVYRIDDYKAGYHIYVLTTTQSDGTPQIIAVPMQKQE
ncbi:MAG: hypothetical protein ACPGRX_05755 [Bdellovibrionales bacterium]